MKEQGPQTEGNFYGSGRKNFTIREEPNGNIRIHGKGFLGLIEGIRSIPGTKIEQMIPDKNTETPSVLIKLKENPA